jgi:hypothetical protein
MLLIFSTPVLIRHLWQLKTVVSLHWCLMHTVLLWQPFLPRPLWRHDINRKENYVLDTHAGKQLSQAAIDV